MLITSMIGIAARSTMDMDTTVKGYTLSMNEVTSIFEKIISIKIDDNVELSLLGIEEIHELADYPGYRLSIRAILEKTRQIIKVDITTGDEITPKEIEYFYPLMLEDRSIGIMAYNLETILAEKFETCISLGVFNSRMRDFYDIYIMTSICIYDSEVFKAALYKTMNNRGTIAQLADAQSIISSFEKDKNMMDLWGRYRSKNSYAEEVTWNDVIDALYKLCAKAYD
ncbi:MAG: nucleotidyl transferase AbiEii/AbiGii toxin family protein [Oscillospiraceae bacterium]|nr:nucleotidyl transferase AbiEii/AbiGii toxin family protein [Oscillospiraceae bacterium]